MKFTRNIKVFSESQPKGLPNQITEPEYTEIKDLDIQEVSDGSCDNLFMGEVLEYTPDPRAFLDICIKKLRYGGSLVVNGRDLDIMIRDCWAKRLTTDQLRSLIYSGKSSVWSMNEICQMLSDSGLEIQKKDILQYDYTIGAKRPDVKK